MPPQVPAIASPEVQAFAHGFPVTLLHLAVTLFLLMVGVTAYALLTPHKEIQHIREGNAAAAISFGGVMVGLSIPLAMSLAASTTVVEIAVWGVATLVLQLLAYRVTDMLLRGLPQRIHEGEVAAAALLVAAKLAVAVILAAAVAG